MPEIEQTVNERYKDYDVQAFGISFGDPEWYLVEFKKETGATFPWLMMDVRLPNPYYQELFDQWELIENHPTMVILDGDGIIRFRGAGQGGVGEENLNYRFAFDLIGDLLGIERTDRTLGVGDAAPDFTLPELLEGTEYTLSDFLGSVVVLEFWTWGCAACGDPVHVFDFKRIYREYPDVKVLSIDVFPAPNIEEVSEYVTGQRIFYPILMNGEDVANEYDIVHMPSLFIIDQDGIIQYREITSQFSEDAETLLQSLLSGPQEGEM